MRLRLKGTLHTRADDLYVTSLAGLAAGATMLLPVRNVTGNRRPQRPSAVRPAGRGWTDARAIIALDIIQVLPLRSQGNAMLRLRVSRIVLLRPRVVLYGGCMAALRGFPGLGSAP